MKRCKSQNGPKRKVFSFKRWLRKSDVDEKAGHAFPLPTQVISNEEYYPLPQTKEQQRVESCLVELAERKAKLLGISRRRFLMTSGGMAAAFIAMNSVFGKFFEVDAAEMLEPSAYAEKWPKNQFIFDIQTHHVAAGRKALPIIGFRRMGEMFNPALVGRTHRMEDLYLPNYIKEIFLDSDTLVAVITGYPSASDATNILPPAEMIEARAEVNGLAQSRRLLSHGLFAPDLGRQDLEAMQRQAEVLKVEAWKGYPGQPLGPGREGWWMDDEEVAYPAYEYARKSGIKTVCVHKGLPLPGFDIDHCSPRDVPKAAADFPDLTFIIYHSGFRSLQDSLLIAKDGFKSSSYVPWVSDLCEARKKNPGMTNVYMELGSTFGQLVITEPLLCGHVLGMMLQAFGDDHVLWGTDAIWWGSPQWQIEAFRRFQMPAELIERFAYKALTDGVKRKILGLNSARIYGVDVAAKLNTIPEDSISKLKEKYRAAGISPSNTQYGWVLGQ
jgi:Predicted metal-dependent hydrolase of the TIM-barrel fold